MSEELDVDVYAEAYELTLALRAHIEFLAMGGAYGVPRAEVPVARSLSEPPPSMTPRPLSPPIPPGPRGESARAPVSNAPAPVADWLASAMGHAEPSAREPVAASQPSPSSETARVANSFQGAKLTLEERHVRLNALASELRDCQRCSLCAKRTQTVFSRGTGSSGLCFVGEGPGADEDIQGAPFVGAAGKVLDSMIAAMGFTRDEVYVCNIVKCRPPENRKPEPAEMYACRTYLAQQLDLIAPEVIVALGATAVQGLLGLTGGITRLRGTWKLYQGRIAVMPTFHPAYMLRVPSSKFVVWDDMKAVLRQMGRPVPERGKKPRS